MDETQVQPEVQGEVKQVKTTLDQSQTMVTQPTTNGVLLHHTAQSLPPHSDRLKECDISLSSNGNASLLLSPALCSPQNDANGAQTVANHRQPSSTSSTSFKADSAYIEEAAGGDCCAHCLLACLFCEVASFCSALAQCLFCCGGAACVDLGGACCCSDSLIGCCCLEVGCTEECGIVETCCGSTDCLEVCLECCSICFPS